jgi:hypothetical protein
VIGQLVINEYFGGVLMRITMAAVGVAIMIGMASLMDWFEDKPSRTNSVAIRAGG